MSISPSQDAIARAARRVTLPPSAQGVRQYTPFEEDRTSAPSTPVDPKWREGGSSLAVGGGGTESRRGSRELRREGSAPTLRLGGRPSPLLGPAPTHLPIHFLAGTSTYSSLSPSPMSTPFRSRSASPDIERHQLSTTSTLGDGGRQLLAHAASFPSFQLSQMEQRGGAIDSAEPFPLHSPPLGESNGHGSSSRSPSPLPSPGYTFPARPPPIAILPTSPSPPQPKRKPSLQPTDPNPLHSVSPLSGMAPEDKEQWSRLTVSAPPSLVREGSSSESSRQRSDVEDNGAESSAPRMLKEGREKVLSVSAEAVPTTSRRGSLVDNSAEPMGVTPTDYLFPLPRSSSASDSPFAASLSHHLSVPRVRSLSSLPRSSPPYNIPLNGSPSSSPMPKIKTPLSPRRALTLEQRQAQRIAELEIEVEMLREREDEWEVQAEELVRRVEEMERVARGGIEGVLSELWVDLATTTPLILSPSFASVPSCPACTRDVPSHHRGSYWLREHWQCLPSLTRLVAVAREEESEATRGAELGEEGRGRSTRKK